ncbi:unnamed protein product [Phyllotreta striolata]|uniref:PHD-type domain-containing protein n=1 Tax=Phyllotreta striolata TaxID=444603 RepID=A0A9P0DUY0_PHYSR|nr:unnamed protein product [Phyllotreta striolata]
MAHLPPGFRSNVPPDMPQAPPNPKKRRKNAQAQSAAPPPPTHQDLLPPPPLSGYGDTIVASNPFDDCPSNVHAGGRHAGPPPPMGMVVPGPGMVMGGGPGMGMYRPMCPPNGPPSMAMMHSPNAHQMNSSMMMNGPPRMGHGPPPHMMNSPNGPNMNMTGPPMHSPLMGGPMNGGAGGNPGGVQMQHGGPPGMNMQGGNGPPGPVGFAGPPMNNNNFLMSPMGNNMYAKQMPVSAGKVYPVDQPMVFNAQNPNAPPIYPCGVCHKEVHDNDQAILCESGCNFWFHRGCTGLTEAAFQLLTAEVYAEWACDKCLHTKNIPLVKFKP